MRREKWYKRQISQQRTQIKRRQTTVREPELQLRETETEAKLETTHHPHWPSSSPLWRKRLTRKSPNTPILSAPVTSDWPRTSKSNNPTTIKHKTFFYFLIPYQHVFTNPAIWTFYSFVSNTIVKIFTCLRVLCLCICVFCFVLFLFLYTLI